MKLRKLLFFLLVMATLFAFAGCELDPEDTEKEAGEETINGVTVYVVSEYRDNRLVNKYEYDAQGNRTKAADLRDGAEHARSEFFYDSSNRITREDFYRSNELIIQRNYIYDEKGNLIRATTDLNGEERSYFEYTCDEKGNVTLFVSYIEGEEDSRHETTYDENGNILLTTFFQAKALISRQEFKYDAQGNKIEELYYDNNNGLSSVPQLFYRHTYTYDEKGNLLRCDTLYYQDNTEGYESYTYDSNGKLQNEVSYLNGKEISRYTYTYDDNGCMIKKHHTTDDGLDRVYTYKYTKLLLELERAKELVKIYGEESVVIVE